MSKQFRILSFDILFHSAWVKYFRDRRVRHQALPRFSSEAPSNKVTETGNRSHPQSRVFLLANGAGLARARLDSDGFLPRYITGCYATKIVRSQQPKSFGEFEVRKTTQSNHLALEVTLHPC